jgi:uncharacterized membrane-anchored protein YhcB (DUF1043 family)
MILLVGAALLLGAIAGFVVARLTGRRPEPPQKTDEEIRLRRQVHDLTAELQKAMFAWSVGSDSRTAGREAAGFPLPREYWEPP